MKEKPENKMATPDNKVSRESPMGKRGLYPEPEKLEEEGGEVLGALPIGAPDEPSKDEK